MAWMFGWTPEGPPSPPRVPKRGWFATLAQIAQTTGEGDTFAAVIAHLRGTATGFGDTRAAVLAHLSGKTTGSGDTRTVVLAHLTGQTTGTGDTTASWLLHFSRIAQTTGTGDTYAALLAHLRGTATGLGDTATAVLAHLAGTASGDGSTSAGAAFTAHALQDDSWAAAATVTYQIPGWSIYLDLTGVGAGGGGREGDGAAATVGNGGKAGQWNGRTLQRGVDIPWSASTITVTVGQAGPAGARGAGDVVASSRGGATVFDWGTGTLTCPGGDGGSGVSPFPSAGQSPGDYSFAGRNFTGGGEAASGKNPATPGKPPGGGGGGGQGGFFSTQKAGAAGAPGAGWIRARQT
ncbi:hypothetical protein [Mycobacteroides chelonae]|uniref:glycine-rich domain-containing protein n=1 Tax=Mycobacteroides chelonae TaxID=1774 RepID=UPI000994240A|nr:hypothetical protein [Mycobacteroides chelonae]